VPEERYSPSYRVNTMIGGVIGCALALAYVTLRFLMDVRIKDEDDLNQLFEYPILGQVPAFDKADSGRGGYGKHTYEVHPPKAEQ